MTRVGSQRHTKKNCVAGQAKDDNAMHAHCMLENQGYRHILRICNIYCFSTATVVVRTLLRVTFYVQRLSCFTFYPVHKFSKASFTFLSCRRKSFAHLLRVLHARPISPYSVLSAHFHYVKYTNSKVLYSLPPLNSSPLLTKVLHHIFLSYSLIFVI
jgi:hypothetical protein